MKKSDIVCLGGDFLRLGMEKGGEGGNFCREGGSNEMESWK